MSTALECFHEIYRRKSRNVQDNQRLENKIISRVSLMFIAIGRLMILFNQANNLKIRTFPGKWR